MFRMLQTKYRWREETVKNNNNNWPPAHGLYYFEVFRPGLLCLSLKIVLRDGIKVLKCFHTEQLVKS